MPACPQCGQVFVAGEDTEGCPNCGAVVDQQLQSAAQPVRASRPQSKVTLVIIGVNVVMFVLMALTSGSFMNFSIPLSIKWGANYGPLTMSGQWWRLETSTFLHGGLFHILFNMWALLNLGLLAEIIFGAEQYFALYILAGLGGSVASLWWHPTVVGVGASGAIFGVAGAMLPALFFERNQRLRNAMRGNLGSIAFFVVFNILYGAGALRIDNAAHLGGLATGLLLGYALPKASEGPLSQSRGRTFAVLLAISGLLFGGALYARRSGEPIVAYAQSENAMRAGRLDEAISLAKQAVERDPQFTEAHYNLGLLYLRNKQPDAAVPEFTKVTEQAPQAASGFGQLCVALLRVQRTAEALNACNRAVQIEPNDADGNYWLGIAMLEHGDYDGAAGQFQKVLKIDPKYEGASEALEEAKRQASTK